MSRQQTSNRRGGSTFNLLQSPPDRSRLRRPGIPDRNIPFALTNNTALRLCASSDVPSSTKGDIKINEEGETKADRKAKNNFHEASEGSDFLSDSSIVPQSELETSRTSQLGLLKYEQTSSPFEVQEDKRPENELSRASSSSCLSSISCCRVAKDPRVSETLLKAYQYEPSKRKNSKSQKHWPKVLRNRSKAPVPVVVHELQDGFQKLDVPTKLMFKQSPDRKSLRAVLTLNNVSRSPVTYSVRTSAPDMFLACPSMGIIDPRTSTHVIVKLNRYYRFATEQVVGHQITIDAMALKTTVLLDSRKRLEQFWQAIEANLIPQDRIERHSIHQISIQTKQKTAQFEYEGFPTSCCPMMLVWDQKTTSKEHDSFRSRATTTSILQAPNKATRAAEVAAENLASDIRTTFAWFILSLFALILLLYSNGSKLQAISEELPEEDQQTFLGSYGLDFDLTTWFESIIETFTEATWPQECLEMLGELCVWIGEQLPPSFASIVSFEFLE